MTRSPPSASPVSPSDRELEERDKLLAVPVAGIDVRKLPLRMDEERGISLWLDPDYAPNQPEVAITRDLLRRLCASSAGADDEAEDAHEVGKRDGYESAVQEIDRLTGGDGEYRFCTDGDPDRHTPDAPTMIARIVARFAASDTTERQQDPREDQKDLSSEASLALIQIKGEGD